jgi:hypothetical protein
MSQPRVSRHHADWLSLVEVSGPFVSLPVLMRIFPQGLEPRDPEQAKVLRAAYDEWQDNPGAPGSQRAWVLHVLTAVLGYSPKQIAEGQTLPAGLEAKMPEMGETLHPDFALVGTAGSSTAGQAQLLIASYSAEQALDKPVIGKHWKATPATRMMELLHGTGVPLGLVTNGEHWMLVYAPRGETTGYASWYGALWLDEPITLRAFHSLFGVRRFFGVAADSTLLAMLKDSANDQQEVTDQLGYQVREAVEVLVKSVDALDRENRRALLEGVPEPMLYDAALTIMMRLVFLFAAEERLLLHLGKPLYDDNYAVSTLQEQLQEVADQHGEEVLERRFDAWTRLLATFRAVHGGIQHQDLLMPAYGGSLFDPDRYPFLEGRLAQSSWRTSISKPLAVNNRVVLHLLNSLQRLRVKVPGGGPSESRRISFRALGVEQIGHVYEGLLDRTAVRATEPVLGLKGTRNKEREIPLARLESLSAQGRDKLTEFLNDETGRSLSALNRELDEVNLLDEHRLLIACGHDEKLLERIRPFVNLIREDSFGRPLVTLADSIYLTTVKTRRSTGTHYTPPSLTEPIVQHTLEPLVYEGPAGGLPREQWKLKAPKAILDLKVCDMAMGSGAFLVQACRYMSERLVEAWETLEKQHSGEVLITPEGTFSTASPRERLVPTDLNERIAIARRIVADRCLYGVDISPMAVEMAKLSLWLLTVQRDRPFTFLDHALKCGDSLLGVSSVQQIENFSLRPSARQVTFATANLSRYVEEASTKRRALEDLPSNHHTQIEAKNRLHAEAEAATAKVKALADCLIAFELRGLDGKLYEGQRTIAADHAETAMGKPLAEFEAYAQQQLRRRRTFHWPVEFPEVFAHGGFNVFVSNPPFMHGSWISSHFGDEYARLIRQCEPPVVGKIDYVVYFLRRAALLLCNEGCLGLILTAKASEGDAKSQGFQAIRDAGFTIYEAKTNLPWPGGANILVCLAHATRLKWNGPSFNSSLEQNAADLLAYQLICNETALYVGAWPGSMGFMMSVEDAERVLQHKNCGHVLRPFYTGADLAEMPTLRPSRYVIDFSLVDLADAESKFSELLSHVEAHVKPERMQSKKKIYRDRWWQFCEPQHSLFRAIRKHEKTLAVARVSKYFTFRFVPTSAVFSDKVIVYDRRSFDDFAILNSEIHNQWALLFGATHGAGTPNYKPGACGRTFPFPKLTKESRDALGEIGERLERHLTGVFNKLGVGPTETYNRFHKPDETSEDIARLRALHVELNQAVAVAYGWNGLDLGHGFHETKQGMRYTLSGIARRIVLDRLLDLNHQRHAEEEVEKAAHAVSAPVKRRREKRDKTDKLTFDLL